MNSLQPTSQLPPLTVIKVAERIRNGLYRLYQRMVPSSVALVEMMSGIGVGQALYVAAKLGIADYLKIGPQEIEVLAQKTNTHAASLYRVLRALVQAGVFRELPNQAFALTAIGHGLRSDAKNSIRDKILYQGDVQWSHWGKLLQCTQTGKSAVTLTQGMSFFEFLTKTPLAAESFDHSMSNITEMELAPLLGAYDFSEVKTLVDVGGGHGRLLSSILVNYTNLKAILLDLPHVTVETRRIFQELKLLDRCQIISGNFLERIPAGGETYILKHILRDWPDENALLILKQLRTALPPRGKLLVIEAVVPKEGISHLSKLLDLESLVTSGGKERTEVEYRKLFAKAGLRLNRVISTVSAVSILEASPL